MSEMSSHKHIYQGTTRHQLSPKHGLLTPSPYDLYQQHTDRRPNTKRQQISQLRFTSSSDVYRDPHVTDILRTFAKDSISQVPLAWNSGGENNIYPAQSLHSRSQLEPTTLLEGNLRQHTLANLSSAEFSSNPWVGFDLQPNGASVHFPIPTDSEDGQLDSCPDSLLDTEELNPNNANLRHVDMFLPDNMPSDQTFSNSFWADAYLSNASINEIIENSILEPICFTNINKDTSIFANFAVQTGSGGNYGQSFEDSWRLGLDSEFQLNPFDDSQKLYSLHGIGTETVYPDKAACSPNQTLVSNRSVGLTQGSDALSTLAAASTGFEKPSYNWDSGTVTSVHKSNTLPALHNTELLLQNTTANSKPTITPKQYTDPQSLNWEHISSKDLKPRQAVKEAKRPRKAGGRRQGRLNPDTAKDAKEMRHLRACLLCSILKTKCTPGDICKRCSGLTTPILGKKICTRAHLDDFTELFFPAPFVSYLEPTAVGALSDELNLGYVGTDMNVEFTCGHGYLPMRLPVSEFALKSSKLAGMPTIVTESKDGMLSFQYQYPLPIASRSSIANLVEQCRNYVKLVVKHQRNRLIPITWGRNEISKMILVVVNRYHISASSSRNTSLLDKAMMLHAMYFFMGTTLTITDASTKDVEECLQKPTMRTYDSNILPRLLNRQIKSAMHALRRRVMREVLEELEKELRTRSKAMWATCFCVALILCVCIEDAQIAMDAFTMHTRNHGVEGHAPSSQVTIENCRKLDDLLFGHLVELFHTIYKTHDTWKEYNSGRAYNPIRDKPVIDVKEGLDRESRDLVNDIRQIIAKHGKSVADRAKMPSFGSEHDNLAQHMAFRERNSARLLSSFLNSFHFTGHE